ncbi:MAG: glycoside hydrolase family 2 TIM barrel-domain containing protein [Gemmatimonadaceae bacterium]
MKVIAGIAFGFLAVVGAGTTAAAQTAGGSLYVFSDTTGARIDLTIPAARRLAGAVVRGTITDASDTSVIWSGNLGILTIGADGKGVMKTSVTGLKPKRWSPQVPALYHLIVSAGTGNDRFTQRARFGFRTMSTKDGRLLLNGRPVYLRGNAINPPERNVPDSLDENRRFVEPYVRYLKSVGVNIIRLTRHSQVWFDVCDELGMMLFQGNYGTPQGAKPTAAPTRPFKESLEWYKRDVIGPLVNHPSAVIYVLSNEQADAEIPYLKDGAAGINAFLTMAYDSLRAWDDTRLYIANAGYGFGRAGDICDLHRYWGWYYNSFLSFYTMRDPNVCWRSGKVQPMTMTELVGNYTGVDGRYNLVPNTKQPDSQLNWTGHAPTSEQAPRALGYQAWMAKQAIEIMRRTRARNPNLAGVTPFTILFHNWWGINRFEDMKPKPIARQYAVSYQPVLLSWEMWTPQVYAGSTIRPVAHVVNDADDGAGLSGLILEYTVTAADGAIRMRGRSPLPDVPYYGAGSTSVAITLPADLPTATYTLGGSVVRGGDTISRNEVPVFVAARSWSRTSNAPARRVVMYDPAGTSAAAFEKAGIAVRRVESVANLSARDVFVIGADAWDATLARDTLAIRAFVNGGGRAIILHQKPDRFIGSWLPAPVRVQAGQLDHSLVFPGGRPFREGMAVNPERPGHPVLNGIDRDRLFLWSDFTNWNESRAGVPQVYPVTRGFVITDAKSLGKAAVIANYDHGLEGIALAELFDGKGSVLMTGLDIVSRIGLDPVADRMLANIVSYMSSPTGHESTQLIDSKIVWGDYASERGLLTGVYSGFLLNTVPVVPKDLAARYPLTVDAEGNTLAGGAGGWNTKPAIQYVPKGRRAFGPYAFTSGGSVELPKGHGPDGEARFWLRIPPGRNTMVTTVSNPVAQPLGMTIDVNGAATRSTIPAMSTIVVETPVRPNEALGIVFSGDRRLVVLETDFR